MALVSAGPCTKIRSAKLIRERESHALKTAQGPKITVVGRLCALICARPQEHGFRRSTVFTFLYLWKFDFFQVIFSFLLAVQVGINKRYVCLDGLTVWIVTEKSR